MPPSNSVPRVFGFVHHSVAILYHEVPNPNLTIRNFCIAVGGRKTHPAALAEALLEQARVARGQRVVARGDRGELLQPLAHGEVLGAAREPQLDARPDTAVQKLRIVRLGFGTARQKTVLE